MRLKPAPAVKPLRTEQIILFRSSNQIFAISSGSVQEVRSVDSLAGAAIDISEPRVDKVRHAIRRGDRNLYVVNVALHFGLTFSAATLVFVLRKSRVALLIDGIDKMTTMTMLQALPNVFCHEERRWYRGLTVLDQSVIPVVSPEGFLTRDELSLLDAVSATAALPPSSSAAGLELNP